MLTVTDNDFSEKVLQSDKPVVVDFWAEWCGPCKFLSPIFERASKKFTKAVFVKLNVDDNPETPSKMGVLSIPTIKVFSKGKFVGEIVGALPEDKFVQKLEGFLR